ncbi:unnamed protein product [Allacma fusca]|uniref:2,3-bisphosphoglycerate 3-phosphatase n=1 Tax=Allacma fusca TaxID=39272 RepID=A0A8J2KDS2_9HEXA|nr:unnamed protein product [Allacma fusca]
MHRWQSHSSSTPLTMLKLIFLLGIALVCVIESKTLLQVADEDCHTVPINAGQFLATKTPYSPDNTDEFVTPTGCSARQIWILNRHGTRNPGDEDIIAMQTILPKLRDLIVKQSSEGKLCEAELERIKSWETTLNVSEANYLVKQGYLELAEISHRFQNRFPELFPKEFSNASFYFRTTVEQRAIESGKSFAGAIFGTEALPSVYFQEPMKGDQLLHFYKVCPKWIKEVNENPAAMVEANKFKESPWFENMLNRITQRLNLKNSPVTIDEAILMYKTCALETAWETPTLSPWCAVFDEEDLRTLEYQEDLEDYWQDGYAYPITYEQACMPLVDLVERFSARIDNSESSLLTTAYFAHSGTVLKVFARLGLFRDPANLTSDGYENSKSNRQWLNSKIDWVICTRETYPCECLRGSVDLSVYYQWFLTRWKLPTDTWTLYKSTHKKCSYEGLDYSVSFNKLLGPSGTIHFWIYIDYGFHVRGLLMTPRRIFGLLKRESVLLIGYDADRFLNGLKSQLHSFPCSMFRAGTFLVRSGMGRLIKLLWNKLKQDNVHFDLFNFGVLPLP